MLCRPPHPVQVKGGHLAHLHHRVPFAVKREHVGDLLFDDGAAIPFLFPAQNFGEDVRACHGGAGDHHPVGARLIQHFFRVFPRKDAAVGDDGDRDRPLGGGDLGKVGLARVDRLARPPVHGEGVRARVFTQFGKFGGERLAPLYADAELDGDRLAAALAGGDDRRGFGKVFQQGAALAVFDHLGHGAAHVEIDDGKIFQILALARLAQDGGVAAEQLRRRLLLPFARVQQRRRRLAPKVQALGADHFGKAQPGAELIALFAEGEVGIARQRRHPHVVFDGDAADAEGLA